MYVDSHQHYWALNRGDYRWMYASTPAVLRRDYLPADLAPFLSEYGVGQTVVVQAADTVAETNFLLDLASRHDSVAGIVGWLDVERPEFPSELARYFARPQFVGIRPMLQYLPDDYILRPIVLAALKEMAAQKVPLDILITASQLPFVLKALDLVPGLHAVVDHIAKPDIRSGSLHPWKENIEATAKRHPGLYCKLSGMVTEADHNAWRPSDLQPYVEHIIECFGFDRVMFGSDWPVCLMAGSYGQVIGSLKHVLQPHLSPATEAAVFGENATRFYGLTGDTPARPRHRGK